MATANRDSLMADSPFISTSLRESANACTREQAALAARLRLSADVIDALLNRVAQMELAARVNKSTVEQLVRS